VKSNSLFSLVALGLLVACGSSEKGAEHAEHEHGHEHGKHHDEHAAKGEHEHGKGHGEHHPKMEGAVKSFHEVLRPVYHMEKGPGRVEAACKASASMKEQAAALVTEAGTDEAATKRATRLQADVTALEKDCLSEGRASVEATLETLHDSFHAVMEKK
jgi:ABC-type Zn2+ transport system substrate-binding protein/surface adhesin